MLLVPLALLVLQGNVTADERGDHQKIGRTSSDTTSITFGVAGGDGDGWILIQNLQAIPLGTFGADATSEFSESSTFCVYRTGHGTGAVDYTLKPESTAQALTALDTNSSISYKMEYSNPLVNEDAVELNFTEAKEVSTSQNGSLGVSGNAFTCTGENGRLTITADINDIFEAEPGNYSDTLTLVVEPI